MVNHLIVYTALIFYDNVVTWDQEVRLLWGRKWTSVSILFYLTRWTCFALAMANFMSLFDWKSTPVILSALRLYAITGKKWLYPCIIGLLGLVPAIGNIIIFQNYSFNISYIQVTIASRSCTIASDALVLLVTWRNTYHLRKAAREVNLRTPITSLFLINGTVHFILFCLLNVVHMNH
ncbi:hypothetical protein OBBRIDRAFT_372041 [Obba rivulosa]|uniref:DUF6533 domain-containing protein n=1 Tax=Obba rivulosa TaxID=1052685 RepID=A0A8E2B695_9APHY|nr:hypothetical protein OBBRIDRAFT_372041 [Obba rivulosa]